MTYNIKKIDHIQLAAPTGSEDIARTFFVEKLGFEEVEKPEELRKNGGVWFVFSDFHIHIGIEEPFVPAKKAHPAFEVENIESFKEHLQLKNIEVEDDDRLPGARRFYVFDPFGNRLEFLEWKSRQ